jgi:hypothetical protein
MAKLVFVGTLIVGAYWLFGPTGQAPTTAATPKPATTADASRAVGPFSQLAAATTPPPPPIEAPAETEASPSTKIPPAAPADTEPSR